ncbi:MAG: hypothetical protein JNM68_12215 [Dinghuibacter sp.]|nr:hypothetical protein [Dinghuibacter sp.]
MKKCIAILFALFSVVALWAQENTGAMKEQWDTGMVNTLKKSGGIYGVIAVLLIILGGIFFYLYRMEKKINRLEQQQTK